MKWIFMLYVSRSGSTFLSHNIAKRTDKVRVLPETKCAEIALEIGYPRLATMPASKALGEFKRDRRWESLGIDDEDAFAALRQSKRVSELVERLLAASTTGSVPADNAEYTLVKNGAALSQVDQIAREFEDVVFLHVRRDVRGSTSSRLKRISAFHDQADIRATDTLYLARYWVKYINDVNSAIASGYPVIEVPYETLCSDPDTTIADLFGKLDIAPEPVDRESPSPSNLLVNGGGLKLSEKELAAKHANAQKPAMPARATAWQTELKPRDGVVIESIAVEHLDAPFYLGNVSALRAKSLLLAAWFKHQWINVQKTIARISGTARRTKVR